MQLIYSLLYHRSRDAWNHTRLHQLATWPVAVFGSVLLGVYVRRVETKVDLVTGRVREEGRKVEPRMILGPQGSQSMRVRAPDFLVYGVWGMHELYTIMGIFLGIAVLPRLSEMPFTYFFAPTSL
ncbi:unnamed protein product [Sphenostylis stenocarpa]|uniref:Uncharacterized protein n=1 Tax=Sphenostylis stenocarpa TaxID=92480 RepID=A0AA86RWA0_9FABA|nr:unnamed protein product [Sphenostylis stenocarpa]